MSRTRTASKNTEPVVPFVPELTFDEKVRQGHYDNKLPYPSFAKRTTLPVAVDETPELKAAREAYDVETERLKAQVRGERDVFNAETNRLYALFKSDLEAEYSVERNPKKDKLFEIAWSDGHANGYSEVANCYGKMVDLIRELNGPFEG